MLRRFLSITTAAAIVALAGSLFTGEPAGALQGSSCGGHPGPECTTAATETCFNLIVAKWCSRISTINYYPPVQM